MPPSSAPSEGPSANVTPIAPNQGQEGHQDNHGHVDPGKFTPQDSEHGEVDLQEVLQRNKSQLDQQRQENQKLQQELEKVRGDASGASKRIKEIESFFRGDQNKEPEADPVGDEVKQLEAEMDEYLSAAIEAERQGRPIPLTVNSAIKSLQHQIRYAKENSEMRKKLEALEGKLDQSSHPELGLDRQAYSNIDTQIESALSQIYGNDPDVVDAQFDVVSKRVAREVTELQKEDPVAWRRIRKNPDAQRKLVNHFVQQHIPPRARQVLEEDHIRRTPMSADDLLQAFREAKEKAPTDPVAAKELSKIRQELLAARFSRDFKTRGGGSTDLF